MKMTFQLWDYDLWGAGSEVWVNDRFPRGCITINVNGNKGMKRAFGPPSKGTPK